MKLPDWIRRTPKSNVGVAGIKKSSSGGSHRGSQGHKRRSSVSSNKGKRKRNSYVSSSITTKNFYPVEHFLKSSPDFNGYFSQHANTLPANLRGYNYANQMHPPPRAPDGRLYENMFATSTGMKPTNFSRQTVSGTLLYENPQHRNHFCPDRAKNEQRKFHEYQSANMGVNSISTMTIDRKLTPTFRMHGDSYLGTLPRTNQAFMSLEGQQLDQRSWSLSNRQNAKHSNSHYNLPKNASMAVEAQLSHKQRQLIPTAATGICRNDSFRRYKIPSPAAILDMINDKYMNSRRKSKVCTILQGQLYVMKTYLRNFFLLKYFSCNKYLLFFYDLKKNSSSFSY